MLIFQLFLCANESIWFIDIESKYTGIESEVNANGYTQRNSEVCAEC